MMKPVTPLALAALILLAACGKADDQTAAGNSAAPSAAAVPAPPGAPWEETVATSPVGGFVLGNPNAPVKLVEYGSLTCSHCAEFSRTGSPKLMEYVKAGTVSWEFRTFLLNPFDVPVSLLARCQGPAPFFKLAEQLYATQHDWVANFQSKQAELQQLQSLPPKQQIAGIARIGGLDTWFKVRGLPQARIDACLGDDAAIAQLEKFTKQGTEEGVPGTPAFLINGKIVEDAASWEVLEPRIKDAIG